jgi:hypothetical protein
MNDSIDDSICHDPDLRWRGVQAKIGKFEAFFLTTAMLKHSKSHLNLLIPKA